MLETKGMTNALSLVLLTVCMAFSKHVCDQGLLLFFTSLG